jgi:hypothetical protein
MLDASRTCSALRRTLDGQSFGCYPAERPSSALGSPMNAAVPCGHGQYMPLSACQSCAGTTSGALCCSWAAVAVQRGYCGAANGLAVRSERIEAP